MEKSATCLHKNLVYIREHYPKVCAAFLDDLSRLENDLKEEKELFQLEKGPGYPDTMTKKEPESMKRNTVEKKSRSILKS